MTALPKTVAPDFLQARTHMVESQLAPNGVNDPRVVEAFMMTPREVFVPSTLVGVAYLDESIPLIAGRSLMQPMVLARLIQAAEIQNGERVLDLAPATGYSTLLLTALSPKVTAVEPNAILHKEAEKNIASYAPGKAEILAGAPVEGCAARAPFDVIIVNGGVEFLPEILFDQLTEGGRLAAVMRRYDAAHAAHVGDARLYRKNNGHITWVSLFDANIPPAPGFTAPRGFTF